MINRGLSYHYDTVMIAQAVNTDRLTDKQHFDFLYGVVQKKKRPFVKWSKTTTDDDLDLIQTVYGCNRKIAEQYSNILNKDQMDQLRMSLNTGGRNAK
jgi:hypothetical protein